MRYLTKSRFKLALDCPTKLYYTKKPHEYADKSLDDPFLQALARGGFQVGELAKCYYPNGVEIEGLDPDKTWLETCEHLKKDNIILYEAALKFENLFVRVDILKKTGNIIELIEVKSKSFNASSFLEDIWQKRNPNKLDSSWCEYIYDIAFQTYVANLSFPQFNYKSFLMCSDKDTNASVDGLNQKFRIKKINDKKTVILINGDTTEVALGDQILTAVDISDVVSKIINEEEETEKYLDFGFKDSVSIFAKAYAEDQRLVPEVDNKCKKCEFRSNNDGLKSGFDECWKLCHGLNDDELKKPYAFDVWLSPKLKNPKVFMEEIDESDFTIRPNHEGEDGLSRSQRQWLQIEKEKNGDTSEYIDVDGLQRVFQTFKFPLHFIDFETSMVAIPYNKNRKPYEQIAFQFSHHVLDADGSYHHKGEWINAIPGKFPNFEFVRALKKELENDNGTIFRYSNHENTVLCQIREQLKNSTESDSDELISWIETVTHKNVDDKKKLEESWDGERDMVDLCEVIIKYYFNPKTKGSNSIKYVLPAILSAQGIDKDPYAELPPVFDNYDRETLDLLMDGDDIRNGGAAMTAYSYLQFAEMSEIEREKIVKALLIYCKLDTEAMVWIYQYLNSKTNF